VETVYFWPNLAKCFKEKKRVLKPAGIQALDHPWQLVAVLMHSPFSRE